MIELMVVVTILAVLATGVGLSAGGLFARPGGVSSAERLTQGDRRARDLALFGQGLTGIRPARDGWQLVRRDGEGLWHSEGGVIRIAGGRLRWRVAGQNYLPGLTAPTPRDAPPIQFSPDGGSSPFSVTVELSGGDLRCEAEAGQELTCAAL